LESIVAFVVSLAMRFVVTPFGVRSLPYVRREVGIGEELGASMRDG
jgi:hypothetical protein